MDPSFEQRPPGVRVLLTFTTLIIIIIIASFSTTHAIPSSPQFPVPLTPFLSHAKYNRTSLPITVLTSTSSSPSSHARISCLLPSENFTTYPTTGTSLSFGLPLASDKGMRLVIIPPRASEGWHHPPWPMWFVLLRGRAVVSNYAPEESADDYSLDDGQKVGETHEVDIYPGSPSQFLLALDVKGKGHWTDYPGEEEMWALQVPLKEGWERVMNEWEEVGEGGCL